ncbi:Uncharacterized protein HZ326_1684 [Fusarium oxysporum f. sp. albedinis]|nr:Uncharacterized protein HZ326_1684 [Fusarium oxysporum f. sp. albedinis]
MGERGDAIIIIIIAAWISVYELNLSTSQRVSLLDTPLSPLLTDWTGLDCIYLVVYLALTAIVIHLHSPASYKYSASAVIMHTVHSGQYSSTPANFLTELTTNPCVFQGFPLGTPPIPTRSAWRWPRILLKIWAATPSGLPTLSLSSPLKSRSSPRQKETRLYLTIPDLALHCLEQKQATSARQFYPNRFPFPGFFPWDDFSFLFLLHPPTSSSPTLFSCFFQEIYPISSFMIILPALCDTPNKAHVYDHDSLRLQDGIALG